MKRMRVNRRMPRAKTNNAPRRIKPRGHDGVPASEHSIRMLYGLQAKKGDVIAHEVINRKRPAVAYVVNDDDPAFITVASQPLCRRPYRIGRATITRIWSKA